MVQVAPWRAVIAIVLAAARDQIEGFGDAFKDATERVNEDLAEQQYLWNLTEREAAQYENVLLSLPDEVKTLIEQPGAVTSLRDIRRLGNEYGLTADQVTTVIRQQGMRLSLKEINALIRRYDLTPKQVRTLLKTQGIEPTLKGLRKVQATPSAPGP